MIVIVGAGGHGQVVADIFRAGRLAGFAAAATAYVDDNAARHGETFAGSVVLGAIDGLASFPHEAVVVAIGDNAKRARLFGRLAAAGERFAIARHPHAVVAEDVVLGAGTMLAAGAIVNTGASIGRNVIINTAATVDHHGVIADHVHIAPGVHIGGEVRVGEGALIGIGAVILPRISIGAWSTVGAGAVVTSDVPPGATVIGVPARMMAVRADV
jgi:sugar O-acyltransferase (sialic acid O-acetyltransferase NeuD family)